MPTQPVVESHGHLLCRLRSEYLEMPGHRLTAAQVQRLLNLDPDTCRRCLLSLVDQHFLCVNADGTFARAAQTIGRPRLMPRGPLAPAQRPAGEEERPPPPK